MPIPLVHRKRALLLAVVLVAAWPWPQRAAEPRVLWNQPFQPFRLVGNIYFVGVTGLSAFLVATPKGAILMDGALMESAPLIARNVVTLGFELSDVKYILSSHVHFDHAGGLAELKRLTGAAVVASRADAYWLQIGSRDLPRVVADRVLDNGDTVALGGTTVRAHITPGHTPGCTTWTTTTVEQGRAHTVMYYCGTTVVQPLVNNTKYPEIVEDYEKSFRMFRAMSADVFLEGHPFRWDMANKRRRMKTGAPNPFVDPTEFPQFVQRAERDFRAELARQRAQP
jgi:metallo-beta-lactamase class B